MGLNGIVRDVNEVCAFKIKIKMITKIQKYDRQKELRATRISL
jgi:hypothetical protein